MMRRSAAGKTSATGGDGTATGDSTPTHTSAPRWTTLCDDIIVAYKAGDDILVLQRFEELQTIPDLDVFVRAREKKQLEIATSEGVAEEGEGNGSVPASATAASNDLERLEFCWGRALLAARRIAGDDDEHIVTIVESFEQRFEHSSDYLRALAMTADGALELLQIYQMVEGHLSTEAITAALHRFPSLDAEETRGLLDFLREKEVPLTGSVAEQLEKHFVVRMKTEDAEDVFTEMRAAGVEPMSTRPYNFLFMKSGPFKHMELLDYYEDMLDRGIAPENSTFRILSKQTHNDGFASQHFSSLAWGNSATYRRRDESERGGTQVFFASRLEELVRKKPDAVLDEALRVFHRMDVEGTQLTNGSSVIGILLTSFCRPNHPEDVERVLRLSQERGCHPTGATVQKVLKGTNPDRFNQAELVLQKVVESKELLQVDCIDLLRHFVGINVRSKAVRVFRAFVIQSYRHPSEPIPFAIASMAMKLGPFDWALGVLVILLSSIDKPLGRGVQSRMRYAAHDSRSREVLAVLERCDWKRDRLLLAPEFQEPTSSGGCNGNHGGGNAGATATGDAGCVVANGHHRAENGPTWLSAMHVALMEMNVDKEVMEGYKRALLDAIEKTRKQRGGTG